MRLNWMLFNGEQVQPYTIQAACQKFYEQYKVVPDTIKMTYKDYASFVGSSYTNNQVLERGKDYGLFVTIPGGMVELLLLEEESEIISNTIQGSSIMVVESTKADREFEKHILNGGK